jgi:hypothetical protein
MIDPRRDVNGEDPRENGKRLYPNAAKGKKVMNTEKGWILNSFSDTFRKRVKIPPVEIRKIRGGLFATKAPRNVPC